MKQLLKFCCMLALPVFLMGCDGDDYYVVESKYDLKAQNIEAVGPVFTAIARQPELYDELVAAAEATLFSDYTDLLPISDRAVDQRGMARGNAVGLLIEAVVRQPEMKEKLDEAAGKFLGPYNSRYISAELNAYAITAASAAISDSYARNPELIGVIQELCKKYLNVTIGD